MDEGLIWPDSLRSVEWLRLASPGWRFKAGENHVLADSAGSSYALIKNCGREQTIGFPYAERPPNPGSERDFVTYDEEVFSRILISRFADAVSRQGQKDGVWAAAGLGPNIPGETSDYHRKELPPGWESVPRDGVGHLYRNGVEVLTMYGSTQYLYIAYSFGFHPDHVLAFRIFGGVTVPIVELPDALGEFIAARPEFTVGWWRPLLPSLELSRSKLGRQDLPPDVKPGELDSALRGDEPLLPHVMDRVLALDDALGATPTTEEVLVTLAPTRTRVPENLVPGDRVMERSYLSTYLTGEDLKVPIDPKLPAPSVIVRLSVPPGIPSSFREPVFPDWPGTLFLGRGIEWEVDDVVTGSSGALVTGHVVSRRPGELL